MYAVHVLVVLYELLLDLKTETKEYVCQVFYFKESINIWRTTLAFLPNCKLKVYHYV